EVVGRDEVLVQPEAVDDQPVLIGGPAYGRLQVLQVLADRLANEQPGGVEVATVEQDATPARRVMSSKAVHQVDPRIDAAPAARIPDWDVVLGTNRLEERAQVALLDGHLDVARLERPQADRLIPLPAACRHTDIAFGVE